LSAERQAAWRAELRAAKDRGEEWAADHLSLEDHLGYQFEWHEFDSVEKAVGAEKAARCIVEACKFAGTLPAAAVAPAAEIEAEALAVALTALLPKLKYLGRTKSLKIAAKQLMDGPPADPHRPAYLHWIAPLIMGTMRILIEEPAPRLPQRKASELTFDLVNALCVEPEPPSTPSPYGFSAEGIRSYWKLHRSD
jgi:hypothetical protein